MHFVPLAKGQPDMEMRRERGYVMTVLVLRTLGRKFLNRIP